MAMAEAHQAVMEVAEVGDRGAGPLACAAYDRKHRVQKGDAQDEEGNDDRSEEKVGPATELVAVLAYDGERRSGDEHAEQHRTGIAHKYLRRVEIVREEADAQPDRYDSN
jgi:hypothetical protein